MAFSPGTRLGPYEIGGLLGEGGMGQVYRARDTNLNRDVALKILPESFAGDADRVARFKREAQVLASLNHTNIAAIYGVEQNALVMELVEGQDLSALISQGLPEGASGSSRLRDSVSSAGRGGGAPRGLSIDDTLTIARQLIDALEAAHEQGIVHRDLKPANIKVRDDGTVKVLDFGLAKALTEGTEGRAGGSGAGVTESPTLTARATQMGMILGTAAYMAPEQARGRAVDRRADIWAFGVVLYEMLTGRRAFEGDDISITLASVLKEDVTWNALPADLPPSVRRLLRRCLEKDPKRRLSAIGDARLELDEVAAAPDAAPIAPTRSGVGRWERWILASVATVATTAAIFLALKPSAAEAEPPPTARFAVPPPGTGVFTGAVPRFGISPDGRFLTFAASPLLGQPDHLWVRRLDSMEVTEVSGTRSTVESTEPQSPFWSPDSKSLAFFTQAGRGTTAVLSRLQKVDLQGGAVQTIGDFPANNASGSWNRDGVILVSSQGTKGIQRIPSSGGVPVQVTTLDAATKETAHLWPQFLPDGRHFIYTSQTGNRAEWSTFVGSLDSPVRRKLVDSEYARFAAPNVLLYIDGGNLLAQTMDPDTQTLAGEPVLVAGEIPSVANGRAGFALSDTGVLVYATTSDQPGGTVDRRLTWLDRNGKPIETVGPPVSGITIRLSPDAKRAIVVEPTAAGLATPGRSLWVAELDRPVKAPLATDQPALSPIWSTDGLRVRFGSRDDAGRITMVERAASAATPPSQIYDGTGFTMAPLDEAPDGTVVFAQSSATAGNRGLFILSKATGQATPYLSDSADRPQAALSRDGKWLAYSTNESGPYQVVVQPFPDASKDKQQISMIIYLTQGLVFHRLTLWLGFLLPFGRFSSLFGLF